MYIKERPNIRIGINKFCKKHNITISDMYADYPCSDSIRMQLKKMLLETNQLDLAKEKRAEKK